MPSYASSSILIESTVEVTELSLAKKTEASEGSTLGRSSAKLPLFAVGILSFGLKTVVTEV